MRIEKSFTKTVTGYFCQITTNVYSRSLAHAQNLASEVISEFDDVSSNSLNVVTLGGMRRKGMLAIEFATSQEPSAEWMLVDQLDPHK